MCRRDLTGLLVLAVVSGSGGFPAAGTEVSLEIVPVVNTSGNGDPYEPEFDSRTHHTFDLMVTIGEWWPGDCDDWVASGLEAELFLGTFFQAALGDVVPPPAGVVEMSPGTAFDCYYASPGFELGNMDFPYAPVETSTTLLAEWYDTVDTGCVTFPCARLTVILPEQLVATHLAPSGGRQVGTIHTDVAVGSTGGMLFSFSFDVHAVCRGDLNGDGVVDLSDLATLLPSYGRDGGGDLDGDGDTDLADLAYFLSLHDSDGDGVPEPCDTCPGGDDLIETDNDYVPDDCDACPGYDDAVDIDENGVPDVCDEGQCPLGKLIADDGDESGRFVNTVDLNGTLAIAGAPADAHAGAYSGAAYVFRWRGVAGWSQEAKLTASDAMAGDRFGCSVSTDGDRIVVGARRAEHAGIVDAGSAYVFVHDGTGWVEQAELTPSVPVSDGQFGRSVAIEGNLMVVTTEGGATQAYVFRWDGGTWLEETRFSEGGFRAVAIDNGQIAAGDPYQGDANTGAVHVYRQDGGTWIEQVELVAADPRPFDLLGMRVAMRDDRVVAGCPDASTEAGTDAGKAYVFHFDGSEWMQEARLLPVDTRELDNFGSAVAIDGDTVLVGARNHDLPLRPYCGAAYVYDRQGAEWVLRAKLTGHSTADDRRFGFAVALSRGLALVSTLQMSPDPIVGAAYSFAVGNGDCNGSGSPDECDIARGVSTDFDSNGIPDECDCLGDLDGDGDIDLSDLGQLLSQYGTSEGASYEDGDLDGDGDVDLADLAIALAMCGTVCP